MPIFGIGSTFAKGDVLDVFLKHNIVASDWLLTEKPRVHALFAQLKAGDLIYIKSAPPASPDITVMAIGLVRDEQIHPPRALSAHPAKFPAQVARNVIWLKPNTNKKTPLKMPLKPLATIPKPAGQGGRRFKTIFKESDPTVIQEILEITYGKPLPPASIV